MTRRKARGGSQPSRTSKRLDLDLGDLACVSGVEVRRRMIPPVHRDDDPVERANSRHGAMMSSTADAFCAADATPSRPSLGLVLVVIADAGAARRGSERGRAALGLLPLLLAAERRQVQQLAREADLVGAAGVGRVGVEHAVAVAQE